VLLASVIFLLLKCFNFHCGFDLSDFFGINDALFEKRKVPV